MLGVGYLLSGTAPFVLGALRDAAHDFGGGLAILAGLAVVSLLAGLATGPRQLRRERATSDARPTPVPARCGQSPTRRADGRSIEAPRPSAQESVASRLPGPSVTPGAADERIGVPSRLFIPTTLRRPRRLRLGRSSARCWRGWRRGGPLRGWRNSHSSDQQVEIPHVGCPGRRFDTHVGRRAGDHDRADVAGPQQVLEVRPEEAVVAELAHHLFVLARSKSIELRPPSIGSSGPVFDVGRPSE